MTNQTPQRTRGDLAHSMAKGTLGTIPIAGAPVAEIFGLLFKPPLEKRLEEWRIDVGERLRSLEENQGIELDALRSNDEFIDIVTQATRAAACTSNAEKLEALRNAIATAATDDSIDAAKYQIWIQWIDRATEWHIRILEFFDDPPRWFRNNGVSPLQSSFTSSLSEALVKAFPQLNDRRDFYDRIWNDLWNDKLVNTDQLHSMMSGHGWASSRTTSLAKELLGLIRG